MDQRHSDSIEDSRWKKKFFDALEDQDKSEKSLNNRIGLLRRGLVSVSLAGDGLEPELDRDLAALRSTLRAEESEAGLDLLLERIEKAVLRLDSHKEYSNKALQTALAASITRLQHLQLPSPLKRNLRRFGRNLPSRSADPRQHGALIVEFLTILQEVVQTLSGEAVSPTKRGLFAKLFGRPVAAQSPSQISDGFQEPAATPGFAAIAQHAEPVLLRILENIHIGAHSTDVVSHIRTQVAKGLNWYEFVSVLEDISTVVNASLGEERFQYQAFLTELNMGLQRVREQISASRQQVNASRPTEQALDDSVRMQVSVIVDNVQQATEIDALKSAVQQQLNAVLRSMDDFRAARQQSDEAAETRMQEMEQRLRQMEQDAQALRITLAREEQRAMHDALTELPNRAAWDRRIRAIFAKQTPGSDEKLCVVIGDVDRFKHINDTYGHLAGDKVLKILAKEISSRLRPVDFMARYGGEEFVIALHGMESQEAQPWVDDLRKAIELCPFHFRTEQVQITMSFGVAAVAPSDTPAHLFDRADRALYLAKNQGRNRVSVAPDAGKT